MLEMVVRCGSCGLLWGYSEVLPKKDPAGLQSEGEGLVGECPSCGGPCYVCEEDFLESLSFRVSFRLRAEGEIDLTVSARDIFEISFLRRLIIGKLSDYLMANPSQLEDIFKVRVTPSPRTVIGRGVPLPLRKQNTWKTFCSRPALAF